jgi:glycosyltransferase involved in cell wall biosynthesis
VIWLASFPRSGNTFVRNILFSVFGVESSTFDMHDGVLLEPDCRNFRVVKTHMLPSQLIPEDPSVKAVYLVRDGRDALVSMAHHRSDIVAPGTGFRENLLAAIHAEKGSFFGGWSRNVMLWIDRADLIIRFEELVSDPAGTTEKIRLLAGLPPGNYSRIPTFMEMKSGLPQYGSGRGRLETEIERRTLAGLNFRQGKSGGWKEEMDEEMHNLFWSIHGDVMLKMGYNFDGSFNPVPDPDLDWEIAGKLHYPPIEISGHQKKHRVLIEAEKILSPANDGVKRYEMMLLKELLHVHQNRSGRWHFDLFAGGMVQEISRFEGILSSGFSRNDLKESGTTTPLKLTWLARLQLAVLHAVPEAWKRWLTKNHIFIFHRLFDGWNRLCHQFYHLTFKSLQSACRLCKRALQYQASSSRVPTGVSWEEYHLIHLPLQHHYLPFSKTEVPVVVTLHDFTHRICPGYHTSLNIRNAENGWKFVKRKAASAIAVSRSCAEDCVRFGAEKSVPTKVIYEAVNRQQFHYQINSDERHEVCRKYGVPAEVPFFLTLSSIEPRKNLENLLQAFFSLVAEDPSMQLHLVIAGRKGWGTFHPQNVTGFDADRVIFAGFVDDADLPYLCSQAIGFCYVSHYEGFGLPLLEAMNCGAPLIYGNNSSMPEVVGDAGLPADSHDHLSITERMRMILLDPSLRALLRKRALARAAAFSTRYLVRQTLDVYEKTIQSDPEA